MVVGWASKSGTPASGVASITDNAGNTYYEANNSRAVDASGNSMATLWYAKNSTPGATNLTITPNPSGAAGTAVVWEFSGADRNSPLDQTATLNSQPPTSTPKGAPVMITSVGEAVVSIANVQPGVTGLRASNRAPEGARGNEVQWAHLVGKSPGIYSSEWNTSSGTYCATTATFRPLASGGGACDLNQDGVVNVLDVQLAVDMDIGLTPCPSNINGGVCNSSVVQDVLNAALTGVCTLPVASQSVGLSWTASITPSVAGYNVYRGTTSGGPYSKLNTSLVAATNYSDTAVTAGQTYYYVTTSVDSSNDESVPSNEAQATP